jgi:hypothetical protein
MAANNKKFTDIAMADDDNPHVFATLLETHQQPSRSSSSSSSSSRSTQ